MYLKPFALSRPLIDENDLPRAFLWLCAPYVWETSHNLEQFRTTLRYITIDKVNWHMWEIKDAILHDYVQNSILMTKQRILLQGQARCLVFRGKGFCRKAWVHQSRESQKYPLEPCLKT